MRADRRGGEDHLQGVVRDDLRNSVRSARRGGGRHRIADAAAGSDRGLVSGEADAVAAGTGTAGAGTGADGRVAVRGGRPRAVPHRTGRRWMGRGDGRRALVSRKHVADGTVRTVSSAARS